MSPTFTSSIDLAQVALYGFWVFFAGLIWWLRREDRREGYPLEGDNPRKVLPVSSMFIPAPKTFAKPEGGESSAPSFARDEREVNATRLALAGGSPLQPNGDPLLSGVGPASWAARHDEPELTREGHDLIQPMRKATTFTLLAGPDPRGWPVLGADGKSAGTVKDLWVDAADVTVRYLELSLENGSTRLVPVPSLKLQSEQRHVSVDALLSTQFEHVPVLKSPDRVTVLEEEKISAFYAGGRLYAEARRLGPVV
ncbi:MAG: photosynthetic reaction center subunit H [Myxococcaceae bacterium]|nr:photosynthetic reaction center subunit H [Myxococcaceae bacterium]